MKSNALKIEYIRIDEIKAYDNNPRNNEEAVEKVMQSIQAFGIQVPAIVDADNVLIAGHTRIMAAIKLGITEFPCVRADDLTKNEAKAYRLADNRMQEDSEWDIETLKHEFNELRMTGFDIAKTGFDAFELENFDFSPQNDFLAQNDYDSAPDETNNNTYEPDATQTYESEHTDDYTATYDSGSDDPTEETETSIEPSNTYTDSPSNEENQEFTCIVCCCTDAEKDYLLRLIGMQNDIRKSYYVAEIIEAVENWKGEV